ncbi:DUF3237 domain-containing protein [Ramlibacter sp.]|uniref:DUF3237 domain-containing protein n=1 Tax=Ramlibacter sp. TaxID=1917967 RepID=UPI001848665A|nr:DUF3237 domain-containing protein [Ramlibacter sp.]MBA2674000.1 DUF3237 domain-containing protein [Ramlibacter sp.]
MKLPTPVLAAAAAALGLGLGAGAQAAPATPLDTQYLGTLYAPLEAPQAISAGLLVFHPRPGGRLEGAIRADLINPAGDWVRIMPNGSMRIDVRLTARLDDGELLYVTYNGVLKKPDAASWERFMQGEKIAAPQWYYVIAPTFETASKAYAWLNDVQAVGKFISIQTGPQAHVMFDLYAMK